MKNLITNRGKLHLQWETLANILTGDQREGSEPQESESATARPMPLSIPGALA